MKNWNRTKIWTCAEDLQCALVFVVLALIVAILAFGCGAPPLEGEDAEVELGQSEKSFLAYFAVAPNQTQFYTYGSCTDQSRMKCRRNSECPTSATCFLPKTPIVTVFLEGSDPYSSDWQNSWKFQFRRMLGEFDGFAGTGDFDFFLEQDGPSDLPWAFTEVATAAEARVIVRNNTAGWPCTEGHGSIPACANKTNNWFRILEPSSTNQLTVTETPVNFPGVYKTTKQFATQRVIELNVNGLIGYVTSLYNLQSGCTDPEPSATCSALQRNNSEPHWLSTLGPFHFALEHLARTSLLTLVGIGLHPTGPGAGNPSAGQMPSGLIAVQSPYIFRSSPEFAWYWNADNWLLSWESCQLRHFSTSNGTTTFGQPPAGCNIP